MEVEELKGDEGEGEGDEGGGGEGDVETKEEVTEKCVSVCVRLCLCMYQCFDKLIWCTIVPKSFLFGTAEFTLGASGAGNYDYIITNSFVNLLKTYSQWHTH